MPGRPSSISNHLRERKAEIATVWVSLVRVELPELADLDQQTLLDHLPEFLDGLADWVDGDTRAARTKFTALIEGHAVQRLQRGIDLATLTKEYALLRSTIIRDLMVIPSSQLIIEQLARVNEGLDEAIHGAVRRYAHLRDQVRDRFIGILAHDLRNPLNGIAMASLHLADAKREDLQTLAVTMHRSAQRMSRMIADVIDLVRGHLGGGGLPVTLAAGDLGDITGEAVEELRLAHPRRSISLDLRGDLRGRWDRDRVLQLISNLVGNAIQHGEDPITVQVRESGDRRSLVLLVHNCGPVIPAELLSTLFDPLRLEMSDTRAGLGLGLYIVRQIALAHGAHCDVTSSAERGTTFTVTWPRALEATHERPIHAPASH